MRVLGYFEKKKQEKAQEKRMTDDMSTKLVFTPQCCECQNNKTLDTCSEFKVKPIEYKSNTEKCPRLKPVN